MNKHAMKITSPKSDIKIAPTNSNEEDYIELKFSKPIPADKNFDYQLFKNDTIEVKEKVKIVNPMQINIAPRDSWDPRTNYLLIFKDRKKVFLLSITGILVSSNWFFFILSAQTGLLFLFFAMI